MTTYLDSSVILRHVLGQPGTYPLEGVGRAVSTQLARAECRRSLDRLRVRGRLPADRLREAYLAAERMLESMDLAAVDAEILDRAGGPLPGPLGTLDAIHLATATYWTRQVQGPFALATHDRALAETAILFGLTVVGG